MFIAPMTTRDDVSDAATAAFHFWISFWPVAPLFGVKWRFADLAVPTQGNLAARPAELARSGLEVQERAVEEVATASAVATPAVPGAEAERTERVIEKTMEPAAETEGDAPAPAEKPKGLLAKPPAAPDDLKLIKGIGPSLERQLNGLGIYTFKQLAKFGEDELAWVDENLDTLTFKGRCYRDDWVGQAKAQLG